MGDTSKNEELKSLLQEAQAMNDARVAEVERRLGSQMQQLSLQLEELISGLNRSTNKDVDGTASSHNPLGQTHQKRTNFQPLTGSGVVPRYTKLDFPTFDGSTNPLIWLHRCEKFFSNQHTQEEDKVGLAAFHMLGEAQLWYHQLEIENPSMSWVELKDCCTL
ncbi:hypothetical protein A4A49_64472, partial [Nicotiana attenuata]